MAPPPTVELRDRAHLCVDLERAGAAASSAAALGGAGPAARRTLGASPSPRIFSLPTVSPAATFPGASPDARRYLHPRSPAGDEKTYIKMRPTTPPMERFVIFVSGRVQKVGYRSKVIALAREMGITGWVGNLPDGRVKVVAEGDAAALDRFVSALKVKNALIDVAGVEVGRQDATGEFDKFSKLVDEGETNSRLDRSADLLRELIDVTRSGFSDLGQKTDRMLDKQDQMLDRQDETTGEVRGLRSDLKESLDFRLRRMEADLGEVKSALREKGIL